MEFTKIQKTLILTLSIGILALLFTGTQFQGKNDQRTVIYGNPTKPAKMTPKTPSKTTEKTIAEKSFIERFIESQNLDHEPTVSPPEIQRLLQEYDD